MPSWSSTSPSPSSSQPFGIFRWFAACVTDDPDAAVASDFFNPRSRNSSDSSNSASLSVPTTPDRPASVARSSTQQTDVARSAIFGRPGWLSAGWLETGGSSAPAQTPRTEDAEKNQERHDHCALHFSRTAASKKITDDIVSTVEHALTKAYGTDLPVKFARELEAMKRASEHCGLALELLAKFGDAPLDDSRAQRTVTPADLDYAKQSAQRATSAAIGCSKRLFALAEITDASSAMTRDARLPQQEGSALNAGNIDKALRTIASDEFQHRLTTGLTLEQNLKRGMHQAGTVLQHAANDAVEWLLPTLKTEKPTVYAQHHYDLVSKVRTAESIHWVAQARFEDTKRCIERSFFRTTREVQASSPAERAAYQRRVHQMDDQSDALFRTISDAAKVTSRLESRDASAWRNVYQAERDIAAATAQRDLAVAALPQLNALLEEAKRLPNAIEPSR